MQQSHFMPPQGQNDHFAMMRFHANLLAWEQLAAQWPRFGPADSQRHAILGVVAWLSYTP
jgi:hypothetical protein